jgi:ketosteroid isomerase-like protein
MASRGQPKSLRAVDLARALIPSETDMVEFVRSGGAALTELAEHVAPDFEVEFLPRALGSQLRGEGLAGMVETWRDWVEPYESYVITVEDLEQFGETEVLMSVRVRARTRRDGVLVEHAPAALATIRDGVLVRMRFYLDRDAARADASAGR